MQVIGIPNHRAGASKCAVGTIVVSIENVDGKNTTVIYMSIDDFYNKHLCYFLENLGILYNIESQTKILIKVSTEVHYEVALSTIEYLIQTEFTSKE